MNFSSVILRVAVRLIFPLTLAFAIFMSLKGHNDPGGGFIGGLIAAASLSIYRMAYGSEALHRVLPMHPRWLVVLGLGLALFTGLIPLAFGDPVLRSTSTVVDLGFTEVHLVSATAFDMGVLFVVIGVAMGMINRLSEELDA